MSAAGRYLCGDGLVLASVYVDEGVVVSGTTRWSLTPAWSGKADARWLPLEVMAGIRNGSRPSSAQFAVSRDPGVSCGAWHLL
jgi:hypothetical protein